jgi:hypothetical protein
MRQEENLRRLSRSIADAARPSTEEQAKASQEAAALVVNSVAVMSQPKRTVRPNAFSEATDFLNDAIKRAREAKLAQVRENKEIDAEKPEAKTLAQLLWKPRTANNVSRKVSWAGRESKSILGHFRASLRTRFCFVRDQVKKYGRWES